MIFTDIKFWWFFAAVLTIVLVNHRLIRSVKVQNLVLLVSSYYFYAQWDWRFLSLIIISTLVDYVAGYKMGTVTTNRKPWLMLSLCVNIGILGFFKYFDFFITEAAIGLEALGFNASVPTLNVILPVGISFYTFQTLTYTIDIYRGHLKPTRDLLAFAAYVAFFPQLVAGPIERATNLLHQFQRRWSFNEKQITEGLRLILFGLVLKVCVADKLAPMVDEIFASPESFDGGELALGAVYFAFQIYGDFCGYSTIAIGLAKILGFELMTNFRTPYFATSIQDFWRRWHISLSTFFRDYVYIPLGGSRVGDLKKNRNLIVTFTVSGLWHGANWTFIVWGFYHGVLLIIQNQLGKLKTEYFPKPLVNLVFMGTTFTLVCIGWVVFRAESMGDAAIYLSRAITEFSIPGSNRSGVIYVLIALLVDYFWRKDTRLETLHFPEVREFAAVTFRWGSYVVMFWMVVVSMANRSGVQQFIYFQF
jgi:D-alanyl-lipoteichoic acid acyltransferase DltB (MBOAT superfamily)